MNNTVWCGGQDVYVRGKESPLACQDGDEDFVVLGDFVHGARELVVCFAAESVEFRGDIEGDDGELAAVFDEDGFFLGRHGCCVFPLQRMVCRRKRCRSLAVADEADATARRSSRIPAEPRSEVALVGNLIEGIVSLC